MSRTPRLAAALGPAFVAAVAYVDPGNVAANLSAGASYSYALVWVLMLSSVMAIIVQYQSAKLGVVTGRSLSSLVSEKCLGRRHGHLLRGLYALQATAMAIATDAAEVIGGALALQLLFGLPLWLGGLLVGAVTIIALNALRTRGERAFEAAITAVLGLIAVGFLAALFWSPPDVASTLKGLRPAFPDAAAVPLAAAMLGATVMPHAIYLHSTLAADRHRGAHPSRHTIAELLHVQRVDVLLALLVAGSVNVSMLLFAASALRGHQGTDSITAAHATIHTALGGPVATLFAVGLLTSSVGSSLVGTHAGARIMRDLLPWPLPPMARRSLTIIPAVALLSVGLDPTRLLVDSQLVLSFGIAFALVPLVVLTGSRRTMGEFRDRWPLRLVSGLVVVAIVVLNVTLLGSALV